MLLLFETPAGFAIFKVLDDKKLSKVEDIGSLFQTPEEASKVVKLKAFDKFDNTAEALAAATSLVDCQLSKSLRKFIKAQCTGETLAIAESKLGSIIKEKLGINCVHNAAVMELMRGVRSQLGELISGLAGSDMAPMSLGLSHSLSRYKLKFSPDKVDTMIVQAIGLLDDLDKELNTYAMRVREWYGWHFPELSKIVADNIQFAKAVRLMGPRENAAELDFSEFLAEEVESDLKDAAVISMGTEVSEHDMVNIKALCEQVISLSEYRAQLFDYLRSRMNAIAPNLTVLVGELVGARLIAHAGSLMSLAKQPASTVQILGAEKALFRALKTKHETPKYGLIYHASLIGQAPPKYKGKISRVLAAKCSLSIRVDALGEDSEATVGIEGRAKVEARLRQLEGKVVAKVSSVSKGKPKIESYDKERQSDAAQLLTETKTYNTAADSTMGEASPAVPTPEKKKKKKKTVEVSEEVQEAQNGNAEEKPKKKSKKVKVEVEESVVEVAVADEKPKKSKKSKKSEEAEVVVAVNAEETSEKKKKKKERYFEEKEEVNAEETLKKKKRKTVEAEEVVAAEPPVEKKKKKKAAK